MIEYYGDIKLLHMSCAWLSISGFILRGWWRWRGSPRAQQRLSRVLPHCIDTILLASALTLASLSGQWPFQQDWLSAKLLALLGYIGLGMIAFRFGRTQSQRVLAYAGALLLFGYMLSVATWRSPLGWIG